MGKIYYSTESAIKNKVEIIFIFEKFKINKLIRFVDLCHRHGNKPLLIFNKKPNSEIYNKLGSNVLIRILKDYEVDEYQERFLSCYSDWVAEFPLKARLKNKTLREKMSFNGELSYWWFTTWSLKNYHEELYEVFKSIYLINNILNKEKPSAARIIGSDKTLNNALGINITKKFNLIAFFWHLIFYLTSSFFIDIFKFILKLIYFNDFPTNAKEIKSDVIFVSNSDYWHDLMIPMSQGLNYVDRYLNNLPKELNTYLNIIPIIAIHGHYKTVLEKTKDDKNVHLVYLEHELKGWHILSTFIDRMKLFYVCVQCFFSNEFRNNMTLTVGEISIPLNSFFIDKMPKEFVKLAPNYKLYMYKLSEIVNRSNAKVVIGYDEIYLGGRAISSVCKQKKIKFVGLQHGLISPLNVTYSIKDNEINSSNKFRIPIPDIFLIWNEFTKNTLCKVFSWPLNTVLVTGIPKMDWFSGLGKYQKSNVKSHFQKKFKIGDDKKIAVLATGKESIWTLNICIEAMKSLPNWILVNKVHPTWDNLKEHQDILVKNLGQRGVVLNKNLYEILLAGDVLISNDSATGLEAAYMSMPLISLIPPGEFEEYPFISDGASRRASDVESVKNILIEIENNSAANVSKNYDKFIQEHMNPKDGFASKRVIELVKLYIDKK